MRSDNTTGVGPNIHTPEWHEAWYETFGGSEAAGLCGMSEYCTPLGIYASKVCREHLALDTEAMRVGRHMEPAILSLYGDRLECRMSRAKYMLYHPEIPFLRATPDAFRENGRAVEAKWSMSSHVAEQLGEEGSDWIPTEWLFQVQQQMDVMGEAAVDIAAFVFGRLKIFTVERNQELIDAIQRAAFQMRDRVEKRDPPPVDFRHPAALCALRAAYPGVIDTSILLPDSAADAAERYQELGRKIKALQGEHDAVKAEILSAMGQASSARIPGTAREFARIAITGGKEVSYTTKPSVRLTVRKTK